MHQHHKVVSLDSERLKPYDKVNIIFVIIKHLYLHPHMIAGDQLYQLIIQDIMCRPYNYIPKFYLLFTVTLVTIYPIVKSLLWYLIREKLTALHHYETINACVDSQTITDRLLDT